jgi:hypothetical protein
LEKIDNNNSYALGKWFIDYTNNNSPVVKIFIGGSDDEKQYPGEIKLTSYHSGGSSTIRSETIPGKNVTFILPTDTESNALGNYTTAAVWHSPGYKVGKKDRPVYIMSTGKTEECTLYAGGTQLTLNGTLCDGRSAIVYSPTSAGSSSQVLCGSNSNAAAPNWVDTNSLTVKAAECDGKGRNIYSTYETKDISTKKLTAAKAYTDSHIANLKADSDAAYEAIGSAAKALADAKAYTDEAKLAILGSDKLNETYDTLIEISEWITSSGVDATELANAVAAEKVAREDADSAILAKTITTDNGIAFSGNLGNLTISGITASDTAAGVVSIDAQTFKGLKTFVDGINVGKTLLKDVNGQESKDGTEEGTTNVTLYLPKTTTENIQVAWGTYNTPVGDENLPVYISQDG